MSTFVDAQVFPFSAHSLASREASVVSRSGGTNHVGVCFSGGGSRALSAAMGQLRGLKHLGVLDDVLFISSVSGGTWASSAFTYLPADYDDDDFLGRIVADPGDLTLYNWDHAHPERALDYLAPNNLGQVPQTLTIFDDLAALLRMKLASGYADHEFWEVLVGAHVLGPWGLWSSANGGFPDRSYSLYPWYLKGRNGPLARNPGLTESDFYLVQRQRPLLVMNGTMFTAGGTLVPFESTGVGAGVRHCFPGAGPGGRDIGGGTVEPFGFDSVFERDLTPNTVRVDPPPHRFSLNDIVGISSAFFAGVIEKRFPGELGSLIPTHSYWPVEGRSAPTNTATRYRFGDGGLLDDTGITALLARRVPNIIAFVNSETPLRRGGGGVTMSSQVPLLFGLSADDASEETMIKRELGAIADPAFSQVFETSKYAELANGLASANLTDGGTAMYTQELAVQPNANYGIEGNYTARVLWIYNTPVQAWWSQLEAEVRGYLDLAVDFPNYNTFTQVGLSAREVNALAHLSAWNVMSGSEAGHPGRTNADLVLDLFHR